MRAVIDTNLLVSATISRPGSTSRRLLEAIRDGRLTLILSRPLIDEFIDVMGRRKLGRYDITMGDVLDFMEGLLAVASVVQITGIARGCDDSDDDAVIETAEVGAADYLLTGDSDLRDSSIRESLGRIGIEVITASDFLRGSIPLVSHAIIHARMIVAMRSVLPSYYSRPGARRLSLEVLEQLRSSVLSPANKKQPRIIMSFSIS